VVLALVGGLLLGLATVVIVLVSSVGAVVGACQQAAQEAPQAGFSNPSGTPGPSYVSQEPSGVAVADIPSDYLALYRQAAEEYGLDWAILAAIGKIETDHGRLDAPGVTSGENSAGAGGPMQFLASTWANVGVDGNGDGVEDRYDPEDAIPGAANYLKLSGAPQDYHSAILAYNHAEWYFRDVVDQAGKYRAAEDEGDPREGGEVAASRPMSSLATLLSPFAARAAYAEAAAGTVGSPGETDYSSLEVEALGLINDYREQNGPEPLLLSDHLSTASARYAHDMAKYDAYGEPAPHVSGPSDYYFEGATLTDRMNEEGYFASRYGENIAAGQGTAERVFEAWHDSPPHNAMMLNGEMRVVGIGLVDNPGTSYGEFWVTDFGSEEDDTSRPVSEIGGSRASGEESSGGSGVEGNTKAVFPLPKEYLDSYEDTWGASRGSGRTHEGTDMFAPDGTPIYSITGGEVVPVSGADSRGWNELGGWTVMVEVTESVGPVEAGDTLYYAHMLEPTHLRPGDTVEAGDVVGKVGSTGEGPPGSILPDGRGEHLHLGWYDPTGARAEAASGAMNPFPLLEWLRQNGGTAAGGVSVAPGAPSADLPAYCAPLQALGLVPQVAGPLGGMSLAGVDPAGASPSAAPGEGGSDGTGGTGQQVVEEAKKYLGVPYVLGGPEACVPGEQMDCTCLTTTVFRQFGYELPDVPTDLMGYGEPVEGEPQAGDVLVWDDPGDGTGGHVAISTGDGRIVHANMGTMDTSITPMWDSPNYLGARRLVK
jgi:uncharacterized protein YkwD